MRKGQDPRPERIAEVQAGPDGENPLPLPPSREGRGDSLFLRVDVVAGRHDGPREILKRSRLRERSEPRAVPGAGSARPEAPHW